MRVNWRGIRRALLCIAGLVIVCTGMVFRASGSHRLPRPAGLQPPGTGGALKGAWFAPSEPTAAFHDAYVRPIVTTYLEGIGPGARVLDIGCGAGLLLGSFSDRKWVRVGADIDPKAIDAARRRYPDVEFHVADATCDLTQLLGEAGFDVVVSTEVIEHVASPAALVRNAHRLLRPGGVFVLSTPYHGHLKNIAIALAMKSDFHYPALADGGHIKFFSVPVLSRVLWDAGFDDLEFTGAGRVPYLWKSMVFRAVRPASSPTPRPR